MSDQLRVREPLVPDLAGRVASVFTSTGSYATSAGAHSVARKGSLSGRDLGSVEAEAT